MSSLFFDLIIDDVFYYILNMLDGTDRIRLATVSRCMGDMCSRYRRPVLDPWVYVIPYSMLGGATLDFSKQEQWAITDLDMSVAEYGAVAHARARVDNNAHITFSLYDAVVSEWLTLIRLYPEIRKHVVLTRSTLRMEIDLAHVPVDYYPIPDIVNTISDVCSMHQRSSEVRRFYDHVFTDPHGIIECTPAAMLLRDDAPPLVLPRTLTLRPHQLSAIDYFVRMEHRAARALPMGSFEQWLSVKHGKQTVWINVCNHESDVCLRNPPSTRIEYTSRVLCIADESGLGKTVTMLALMLGMTLVMPLDLTDLLLVHTRASLVIVDPLMLKGVSDWRDLPRQLYPASRVYVVEQISDWRSLSRQTIREADLVIMSYVFYNNHYRMSIEYSDPEETTVLSFQWQRVVLDDHHVRHVSFTRIAAHVCYVINPHTCYPFPSHDMTHKRVSGQTEWEKPDSQIGAVMPYIQHQCTWRRTVRSVCNELARPSINQTHVPVPMTDHENVIIDALVEQKRLDHYDVPVNYKGIWRAGRQAYVRTVTSDPSMSVLGAYKSFKSAAPWEVQVTQSAVQSLVPSDGLVRQQHGSLVTALLLLLRKHWQHYPKEPVLVVCFSTHAVARLVHIFKTQHVPTRTLSTVKLKYTAHERQELKAIGRSCCMVYLVEQEALRVGVNRFTDLRHVFVFGGTLTDTDIKSIYRPVAPENIGAPIQLTTIYPGESLLLDSTYDHTQQPYCDLNTNAIVIVS